MYIPKNRVKEDLYTTGGEYIITSTQVEYVGFYHKLYDGRAYTGKTSTEANKQILSPIVKHNTDPYFPPSEKTQRWFNGLYTTLKGGNPNDKQPRKLPQYYPPRPTANDYKREEFVRYFVVKQNEDIYLEIDKETYERIVNQDNEWVWEMYLPFQLDWFIRGDEEKIKNTNKNLISIKEKRINRRGLGAYLKFDYIQFFNNPISFIEPSNAEEVTG